MIFSSNGHFVYNIRNSAPTEDSHHPGTQPSSTQQERIVFGPFSACLVCAFVVSVALAGLVGQEYDRVQRDTQPSGGVKQ